MSRRRSGVSRVVVGLVLVGGATGTLLWWNSSAVRSTPRVAGASTPGAAELGAGADRRAEQVAEAVVSRGAAPSQGAVGGGDLAGRSASTVSQAVTTQPTSVPPAATQGSVGPVGLGKPASLEQAQQLILEGRFLEARKLVNDALVAGAYARPGDLEAARAALRELNSTLLFSATRYAGDEYVEVITIAKGDLLTKIANTHFCTYELILKINGLESDRKLRPGQQLKVIKGPFHAVVNKRAFTLDVYLGAPGGEGSMYVTTYNVGLGTDNSTPTGLWRVERGNKIKNPTYYSPRGEGVIQPGDPANPLGPFWIGLTGVDGQAVGKMSYGIHGTIRPDTIGKMESMGCIRLRNEEVAQVFMLLYEVKSTVRVLE